MFHFYISPKNICMVLRGMFALAIELIEDVRNKDPNSNKSAIILCLQNETIQGKIE